jgi:hypothetical protein
MFFNTQVRFASRKTIEFREKKIQIFHENSWSLLVLCSFSLSFFLSFSVCFSLYLKRTSTGHFLEIGVERKTEKNERKRERERERENKTLFKSQSPLFSYSHFLWIFLIFYFSLLLQCFCWQAKSCSLQSSYWKW